MTIAILTNGPRAWPSSRYRGFWLAEAAPETFRVFAPGDPLDIGDCDTVVFQKRQSVVDIERARRYQAEGRTVIYDLCDPVWWFMPRETEQMLGLADAVVTSNDGLADAVRAFGNVRRVVTIPDRMLASYHPTIREHETRMPVVLAWYGSTGNRAVTLGPLLGPLEYLAHNLPIQLRIIDGAPGERLRMEDAGALDIQHVAWTLDTFHAQLTACDIALVPPYPGPWGAMKSNNKAVTAWWAGLPAVTGYDMHELVTYILEPDERRATARQMREVAERDYDITKSVEEWRALVADLQGEVAQEAA